MTGHGRCLRIARGIQVLEGLSVAGRSGGTGCSAGKGRVREESRSSVGRRDRAGAAGLNSTGTTSAKSGRAGAVGSAVGDVDLSLTGQNGSLDSGSSSIGVVADDKLIGVGRDGNVRGSLNNIDKVEVKLLRNRRSESECRSSGQQEERAHGEMERMC